MNKAVAIKRQHVVICVGTNIGMLSVMDLVEVNPLIGSEAEVNRTLDAARRLVASAFGSARACNYPDARPTPSESRDSFLVGLG